MKNMRLIEARKRMGFTQEQLAQRFGYKGKQAVSNWENGHAVPPLNTAIEIARLLDSSVDFLFGIKVQESHTESTDCKEVFA